MWPKIRNQQIMLCWCRSDCMSIPTVFVCKCFQMQTNNAKTMSEKPVKLRARMKNKRHRKRVTLFIWFLSFIRYRRCFVCVLFSWASIFFYSNTLACRCVCLFDDLFFGGFFFVSCVRLWRRMPGSEYIRSGITFDQICPSSQQSINTTKQ